MRGVLRSGPRTMAAVVAAGVGLLSAVVVWRRVDVLDRLVADRPRPYIHQTFVIRRLLNPIAVLLGSDTVLFVRGRRSGKVRSVPMDPPFEYEGRRYLVSPLGDTHWARNLRAAGGGELRIDRHREPFRAIELEGAERDAIVTAYATSITCGCRHYMAKLPDPADHPAFRIEPRLSLATSDEAVNRRAAA